MKRILLGLSLFSLVFANGQSLNQNLQLGNKQIEKLEKPKTPTPKTVIQKNSKFPVAKSLSPTQNFVLNSKIIKNTSHGDDPRNLPLSKNGKLLSVDGFEVDFKVPDNPDVYSVCYTPRPYVDGQQKDASCSYAVPCDNPSNRDGVLTSTKYFQLVWHVMTDGGASSNITQTRIDNLMAELNADYASHNMVFCAAPATYYEDATNYNHDINTEEFSLKDTYNVTPTQVVNIYVVGAMSAGGYARFPYDPNGGTDAHGGIVLNRGNCNLGTHTLAHEMGHVFGLEHTFSGVDERGDCSSCYEKVRNINGSSNTTGVATPLGGPYTNEGDREGDWCSDTNPHDTYAYNCGTSSNTNGACDSNPWANAPVNNHMSYSFCSSQFTDQQSRRMHCLVGTYLGSWTSYAGGICGTLPPDADFVGTPTTWQAPAVINFTDLSAPSSIITSYTWTFDVGASNSVTCVGCTGANATFVGQNPPAINYPNPGLYTVSLTLTSANGPDTETKVDYIEVLAPTGDCDTLTTQWETPAPTVITYGFGGGWLTGVADPSNMVAFSDGKGVYEGYFTPNPGVTPIGGVRVGLGSLRDDDDDMTFQVVVYDDDGFGAPGALVGAVGGFSPTQFGVPGPGSYNEFWIPFLNAPIPTTAFFHVGVEIFAGDAGDTLVVMTSCLGPGGCATAQGEADGSNHIFTSGFGYENLLTVYGADLDVDIIPMLGEYTPLPVVEGFTETVNCDTTFVTISDTAFYSTPVSWTFTSAKKGLLLNTTVDPETIDIVYTTPGPDTITISAINSCGRADTTTWIIPYSFMTTPDAEFTKDLGNPICAGTVTTFTADTPGYSNYLWDFGDGTTVSGTASTQTHTYASPGLYYTSLSVVSPGYQPSDTTFLEDFNAGIPATWATFDNNSSPGNVAVNPPFDGTNGTAWLPLDNNGTGDLEAYSNSWNNPSTLAADDWLISPNIAIGANNSLAWDGEARDLNFNDGYEVYVTTGAQTVAGCLAGTMVYSTTGENGFATNHVVDLPNAGFTSGNIRVCFRNNSTDKYLLAIDNVRVGTTGAGCTASATKTDFVEIIDCSTTSPTANGSASVSSGCAPLSVTFTDATTVGDPATSWLWNFDDGTFSTAQNPPAHVYNTAGTYNVIFQACNAGGCTTETIVITINGVAEDGSFTVSASSACQNGTDITATITGDAGGVFSSTGGLSINGSTGAIDVSASTPGTYTVTYTTSTGLCADAQTQSVTINANQSAAFNYSAASYCVSATDPTPTITGTAGGAFSSTGGLSINGATGAIDVSASTPGAYSVTYTTAGPCVTSSSQAVTINALDNSTFTLSAASACQSGSDITAAVTGLGGGTFSSTTGLVISASTGTIDVSASTPGGYTVTYITSGTCPSSSTQSITISADENAGFTVSSASACQNGTDITATISGTIGGTFTSAAGLSINASTGTIDVSASTAGGYTVTYTTAGTCSATSTQSVTINAVDNPAFTLSAASACQGGTDITATISGTTGGAFTSGTGLSINSTSGSIDVSASTAGGYTVTYTTGGTCSATSTQSVTINADEDASFSYSSGTYCVSGADPTPTITGDAGGTFSGAGLIINAVTGAIDLDGTGVGSYVVTYTTSGTCAVSTTFNVGITNAPDATFSYTGTPYCSNAGTANVTFGAGASGGVFTALPIGLSINTSTGAVNLAASTPGTYTVSNTIVAAGGCAPALATSSIVVTASDDAAFSLSAVAACQGGTDITATISGTPSGTFSSAAGLSISATSGTIDVSTSTPGGYTVTYTTSGTCVATSTQAVTINADDDATYSYASVSSCQSGTDITATITGTSGGAFSSTTGLSVNASSGTIDVSASTGGVYTVTYTTAGICPVSSTQSVTITADDDASFNYSPINYCQSASDPTPTITGTSGGTFSSSAGLSLNATTGEVDLSATTIGSYNITYTTGGICPTSDIVGLTITSIDDASFTYSAATYCESDTDPAATITGASGGTFTSTAGVSINATSGLIDLDGSTAGGYTITYTTGGSCSASSTQSVTINADDDASYSYSAASYCQAATDPVPTITGASSGTFASTPAGLSINAVTGGIDVSASTVGSYTITYTTAGTCPTSQDEAVTITPNDDPAFSYSAATYCSGDTDPSAAISGTTGGTFTSSLGLVIDAATGLIDLDASTPGVYSVMYTTAGVCTANSSESVTINDMDDASFSYTNLIYCTTDTDPSPTITGVTGGTFSSTAGLSINAATGLVGLSASTPGLYTIIYTTSGTCPNSTTVSFTVASPEDATFSYASASYCTSDTDPLASISGTTGGTFASTAGLTINSTSGLIDLSGSIAGLYAVTYTTSGSCPATSSVNVTVVDSPIVDDIADVTSCGNFLLPTITGTNLSGTESYYDATGGTGTNYNSGDAITTTSVIFIYDNNGTCSSEESFNVTIDDVPPASDAGEAQTLCDTVTTVILDGNTATVGSGMWTIVSGSGTFADDTDPTTVVSGLTVGANEYMWLITNGSCPGVKDHVIITLEECASGVTIPSAFTPDGGDNINATWEIEGIASYPDCEILIFNKWGSEIFVSKGYTEPWDGTYKGNPLPVGSYFYIIKLDDEAEPIKGTVTIIK